MGDMIHESKEVNGERERGGTQDTLYLVQKNTESFTDVKEILRRELCHEPRAQPVQTQTGQRAPDTSRGKTNKQNEK